MGVPAFYRWLSEKYPKIIQDVLEDRIHVAGQSSVPLPFDCTLPNPSGVECDNLYIDMNGIIHPCSHPEVGPQPASEEEMYENVCKYVDRLFRVMRPRKLLYLAIDGVAPRAKMNQQRARRFRSAEEARELAELEQHVRTELEETTGKKVAAAKKPWDSNVITPGTPFMIHLAEYVRFYIRKRMSTDKAWKSIRVIFSDASLPGEGEHKIMSHIRLQRAQPGYDPNLVHVLHGLDADLIMLALATHEAHFYISREQVIFGRKSEEQQEKRQNETGFTEAQRAMDEKAGSEAMQLTENMQKPLHRVSIPILREYLANEFAECLDPQRMPFEPSLERVIDDFVFLCFFVGNDFLPHLPSLDIRDGALDFLFNVYKRLLPGLGDYITKSGGNVNLGHVDVLLAEVGSIEDYVFSMKHENEEREKRRREDMKGRNKRRNGPPPPPKAPPKVMGRAARILEKQEKEAIALKKNKAKEIKVSHCKADANNAAAEALKASLGGTKRPREEPKASEEKEGSVDPPVEDVAMDEVGTDDSKKAEATVERKESGVVGDMETEFDKDDGEEEVVDPEAARALKEKVKAAQQKKLDEHKANVVDNVRLHEKGWKDRYYTDKCKADDVKNHGGREHLFRSYVAGLCWVMKYYYDGCPSWKWYYPFHYAPFASDLKNIDRFSKFAKTFELSTPFNPVEQLMAVLPSDSEHAIPKESRWLMSDKESPILDFYPMNVPVDPNGKAMPWLWVVLLPFIDEERLLAAMAPSMAKWTNDELFCNVRGLDDGYLYVHRSNGLAKKFAIVLKPGKSSKDSKTKLTDAAAYGNPGFSGSVRPPLANELYPVDEDTIVKPPATAGRIDRSVGDCVFADSVDPNEAVCVAFSEPSKLPHKSMLLPGVVLATPVLNADDKRIRRPRLNRGGGNIANMGTANGQSYKTGNGSMNIGTYERNLAQQTGRGADMYRTGNRAWGAMEPTPKRRHVQANGGPPGQGFNRPPNHGPPQQQNYRPPQQQYQHDHQNHGAPQYQHHGQQQGYQQQLGPPPPPPQYQGYRGPPNNGGQGGYHQQNQHGQQQRHPRQQQQQQYNNQQRGPPPQQQGYDFRSYNQGPPPPQFHNQNGQGNQQHQDNSRRSRASADVMSSLRAQLTSTLNQKRNANGSNQR